MSFGREGRFGPGRPIWRGGLSRPACHEQGIMYDGRAFRRMREASAAPEGGQRMKATDYRTIESKAFPTLKFSERSVAKMNFAGGA